MLVLGRKVDDKVRIITQEGEVIVATIVSVVGGQVRLGFDASADVKILRSELCQEETR